MIIENDIENYLGSRIKKQGWQYLKFTSPGYAGVPDRIILMSDGKLVFCELKKPGKDLRPLQKKRKKEFESLGHEVAVVSTKQEADTLIKVLNRKVGA